ncbi:universal stress protein [Candidatus Hecatella orcuttiae]|jgi:nucleotide-binding universal stress UspA family protein|uniref:universal stress protein n=1 Tax=Candidatus Hecatella orcuttiae TaxID=1935119 RepID=UPI002867E8D4|nr:universal stress protein [Candidatus Hecatella orcuttiae]
MYRSILIPTDGSQGSFKAAEHGINLARIFGSKLIILHVVDSHALAGFKPEDREKALEHLKALGSEAVKKIVEKAQTEDVEVEEFIREGVPTETILDLADEAKVDLIVMGTRGLTGIKRILLGSTVERVIRWASCPVLVVR